MSRIALGEIDKHFWLTRSTARTMGLSLTEAMAEGRLTAPGFAELVTRCRASNCSQQCAIWLAEQQQRSGTAPEFCANAAVFNALKDPSEPGM